MLKQLSELFCLHRKYLVYNLISRNLKIKYKRSFFGYLWSLLVPLAQAAVYYFVFKVVVKIEVPNYIPYIVSGVLLWSFFANTLAYGMEGFTSNRALLTKIPIPLQVFPLVETLSNLLTLLFALPVLGLVLLAGGVSLGWPALFFFYYVAAAVLVAFGLSIVLGATLVIFGDLKHIFALVLQLWMYATPIFYTESMIPERLRWVVLVNPIGAIFTGMHQSLLERRGPDLVHALVPAAWAVVLLIAGQQVIRVARRCGLIEML